ncbi:MAG: hypothetical protein IH812_04305 [Proteobacteria bacterium]|nr:hypothetical protein [Pseudomonadota bacterium]
MNERDAKSAKIDDRLLVTKAKELFDQSVDGLDAETRSRLNRGRHEALAQLRPGVRYGQWLQWNQRTLPAAGVAAAAVVAVLIWAGRPPVDDLTPPAMASDFEILLAEDSFEMLQELEFYSWIDFEAELVDELDTNGNVG